jgi:hypothetical protein
VAAGVLIGLLSSAVAWVIFVVISHPRLRWSEVVAEGPARGNHGVVHQVKLLNLMPWSCVTVQVEAFLVVLGARNDRIIVRVPVRESSFPLIGGSAGRSFRRRKYGWLGSSHRILTVYLRDIAEIDLHRMRRADAGAIKRCHAGDLGSLLDDGAELVVSATAADGLFLGQFRRAIAVYRGREALVSGTFMRGRSVEISQPVSREREDMAAYE